MFALGMIGAALVATIVVTLTTARTLGEIMGFNHSLEHHPREAPWFYGVYTIGLVLDGILVASGIDLVKLSVGVQVMNALSLPIVLGLLFMLARRALPDPYRLTGRYAWVVGITIVMTAGFGLCAGLLGTFTYCRGSAGWVPDSPSDSAPRPQKMPRGSSSRTNATGLAQATRTTSVARADRR